MTQIFSWASFRDSRARPLGHVPCLYGRRYQQPYSHLPLLYQTCSSWTFPFPPSLPQPCPSCPHNHLSPPPQLEVGLGSIPCYYPLHYPRPPLTWCLAISVHEREPCTSLTSVINSTALSNCWIFVTLFPVTFLDITNCKLVWVYFSVPPMTD